MSRGISGFGIILLIIVLLVVGYAGYKIAGVHFKYGSLNEKVETTVRIGPLQSDNMIREELSRVAGDLKIVLPPDDIWIDRSIPDSFRIYMEYRDSSDIFGIFTYNRKFVIDQVAPIQLNY